MSYHSVIQIKRMHIQQRTCRLLTAKVVNTHYLEFNGWEPVINNMKRMNQRSLRYDRIFNMWVVRIIIGIFLHGVIRKWYTLEFYPATISSH